MSIKRRLIQGLGATAFSQGVNLLVQVLCVPLFIAYWGIQLYGEWLLLSTIPVYLAMSDMGFSSVAGNKMAIQVGGADRDGAITTFQSASTLFIAVSMLMLIIGAIASMMPIERWLNFSILTHAEVKSIILMLTCGVIVNLHTSLLSSGLRCDGNFALAVLINSFTRLFEFVLVFILVSQGGGPKDVATVVLSTAVFAYSLNRMILKQKSQWLIFSYKKARIHKIQEMMRPSFAFMAFPIANALKNQGMISVVGVIMNPVAVVTFSASRTLLNSAHQAMGMIYSALWPEVSRAYGSFNIPLLRKLHRISFKISFWTAVILIFLLFFFGDSIIKIWTVGQIKLEPLFFNSMLIVILISSFWFASSIILVATNRHEKMALIYIVSTFLALLLAITILPLLNFLGLAISLLTIEVAMVVYVLKTSLSLVNDNTKSFLRYMISFKLA